MGFNCGIVGLPNVGKSTLFNALTATAQAEASNFPFCTIEPNQGRVAVPDDRLERISSIAKAAKIVPTTLEFIDIAGLVKGASKGEGLGNQFLANIREVDAIIHVLRCFNDDNITHVENTIDPIRDAEIVETELMLADLESLEKRVDALTKKARGNDTEAKDTLTIAERILETLRQGHPARSVEISDDQQKLFSALQLLTSKPVLYVCNVEEEAADKGNAASSRVATMATEKNAGCVIISAKIEEEVAQLGDKSERGEFLDALGLDEPGLTRIIKSGYELLRLITFFTAGPKEARAWTVPMGTKAPQAAGVIHGDFERGFIRAETISYDDFINHDGENGAKEAGKMRSEGRDYITRDGDLMLFRFNV